MDEELIKQLDYLRITGLKERWHDYIEQGEKKELGHERFLRQVVAESYHAQIAYSKHMRTKRAAIPEILVMATFPFEQQPNLPKKRLLNIYDSLTYMSQHQNIVMVGPTGSGKTGLATSYLMHAIEQSYTGYFISFPDLIDKLFTAMAAHRQDRVLKTFAAYDCLVIDELGYVDIEPAQTGLFFRLMSMRHKRKTTIVTSNLGFSEWTTFLKNDQLTAALIDRLTENSHVINMKKCTSIRPKTPDPEPESPLLASQNPKEKAIPSAQPNPKNKSK